MTQTVEQMVDSHWQAFDKKCVPTLMRRPQMDRAVIENVFRAGCMSGIICAIECAKADVPVNDVYNTAMLYAIAAAATLTEDEEGTT